MGIKLHYTLPNHIKELNNKIFKKGLKIHHVTTCSLFSGRIYVM